MDIHGNPPNPGDVDTIKTEVLVDEYFYVTKHRLRQKLHNGDWSAEMDRYILHRPDAVCAVVYNVDAHSTYLVRQFRIAAFQKEDGWTYEIVGGLVDEGEDIETSLCRELEEEIGFRPRSFELIDRYFASPGILTERIFCFYVEVKDEDKVAPGGGVADEHEDINIVEIPLEDLSAFVRNEEIRDAKTLAGLLRLEQILRDRGRLK